MNRREVLNKVKTNLLAQKIKAKPSLWRSEQLRCKMPSGRVVRCAIGWLIDDIHYSTELECCNVDNLKLQEALRNSGVDIKTQDDVYFLFKLQLIHDAHTVDEWETEFAKLEQTLE